MKVQISSEYSQSLESERNKKAEIEKEQASVEAIEFKMGKIDLQSRKSMRNKKNVDICFLVDSTASMAPR